MNSPAWKLEVSYDFYNPVKDATIEEALGKLCLSSGFNLATSKRDMTFGYNSRAEAIQARDKLTGIVKYTTIYKNTKGQHEKARAQKRK